VGELNVSNNYVELGWGQNTASHTGQVMYEQLQQHSESCFLYYSNYVYKFLSYLEKVINIDFKTRHHKHTGPANR
jgi:hypothetical protein